jgi:DMSO/TMAO reductase YedYZ molybdopterin-dependent catalytic subunit
LSVFTRGFSGHRREPDDRLPPGQTLVQSWPVLSAGPTPRVDTATWDFVINDDDTEHHWNWEQLLALGIDDVTVDIHCVTHWSKLDMPWRGVSLDKLLGAVETEYAHVMAESYGGYTTNIPLKDLRDGQAWIAIEADGKPLTPEHGGPARLLVPHLYFWKSAKWIRSLTTMPTNNPGFWEQHGYHIYGDPWKEQRYW